MSKNNQPLKPEGPPSYERLRAYSIAIFRVGGSRGHLERTLLRSIREGTSSNDYLSKITTGRCPSGAFAHTEFWSTSGPAHAATAVFFRPLYYTACSEGVVISDATSAKVKFPNRTNFPEQISTGNPRQTRYCKKAHFAKKAIEKFSEGDRKSTRLNSSHSSPSRMPSSA